MLIELDKMMELFEKNDQQKIELIKKIDMLQDGNFSSNNNFRSLMPTIQTETIDSFSPHKDEIRKY